MLLKMYYENIYIKELVLSANIEENKNNIYITKHNSSINRLYLNYNLLKYYMVYANIPRHI